VWCGPGLAGNDWTDLVDGKDVKPGHETGEVHPQIGAAVGGTVGAYGAAVKKHNDRATTFFEIARADSVHINKFFTGHCFLLSRLRYCTRSRCGSRRYFFTAISIP